MRCKTISRFLSAALFVLCLFYPAWAEKPAPSWNGKPADKMTSAEMRDANKALDQEIKKGDSSAVQKKTDLNKAFDKTAEGQKMKKEDQLAKNKDELAILEKQAGANADREIEFVNDRSALDSDGSYWNPPNHWPSPPDGKIGPGGDRDKRDAKLKKDEEKARQAKKDAEQKIKDLKDKIKDLEDSLYVKTKDVREIGPGESPLGGPSGSTTGGSLQTFESFQMPTLATQSQNGSQNNASAQSQQSAPACPPSNQ